MPDKIAARMSGPFFVVGPVNGPNPQQLPRETHILVAPDPDTDTLPTEGLSDASVARAILIPALMHKDIPTDLPSGPIVFLTRKNEGATVASPITIELLGQIADCGPEWVGLVAFIVGTLKIDPRIIRYRGGSSCYPAVVPPISLLASGIDHMNAWFGFHGYCRSQEREPEIFPQGMSGRVYIRASDDADLMPCAIVYFSPERSKRPNRGEQVPVAVLAIQANATRLSGAPSLVPVFFVLPDILNFQLDWNEMKRHPRIYPATMPYFDLKSGDHLMYPRFVPHNGSVYSKDKIPLFHPGPAFYSWKSGPSACQSLMFRASGEWTDFLCVRESNHSDPVVPCPEEPVRIDRR